MSFAGPIIFCEPKDPWTHCYFFLTIISGIIPKSKDTVTYPSFDSVIQPMLRKPRLSIPTQSDGITLPRVFKVFLMFKVKSNDPDSGENDIINEPHLLGNNNR